MAGFAFFYLISMLFLAVVMKLFDEKPKMFFIFAGLLFVPALAIFGVAFPHVLLRGF